MKPATFSLLLVPLLCAVLRDPADSTAAGPLELLLPGDYHGEEVKAKSGQMWLGLVTSANGSTLRPVPLRIERFEDSVKDEPGAKTGKRVLDASGDKTLLWIRPVNSFAAGPVVTSFAGHQLLSPGSSRRLKLEGSESRLEVISKQKAGSTEWIETDDAKLVLRFNGRSQTLYALGGPGGVTEAYWYLHWAGDLDRDGKLDLLVTVADHYNTSNRVLFLSSAAKSGQLVGEAARLETYGC